MYSDKPTRIRVGIGKGAGGGTANVMATVRTH